MSVIGIILLLLGILVFIASFAIPEQKSKATQKDRRLSEELAKESIEQEVQNAKVQIQESIEENISYSVEKTERALERLTNEKMQAVNEYSDTVLEEINKNHKEVVFLYDMLNDKQKSIQQTVKDVNTVAKSIQDTVKAAEEESTKNMEAAENETPQEIENKTETVPAEKRRTTAKKAEAKPTKAVAKKTTKAKEEKAVFKPLTPEKIKPGEAVKEIAVDFGGDSNKNNNEKILELHKSGKSNMAIAKELGLGVGEVKLVIDLFESM